MKKTVAIIICVIMVMCIFCACANQQEITAPSGVTFTSKNFSVVDSFESVVPEAGNQLLAVTVHSALGTDPDSIIDLFFGEEKSNAIDKAGIAYPCTSVVYGETENAFALTALYEIPSGMGNETFTISGPFESFSGTAKK